MYDKSRLALRGCIEAIEKIEAYTAPFPNADAFYQDHKTFDASMMNFVLLGEMVSRMSDSDYSASFIASSSVFL